MLLNEAETLGNMNKKHVMFDCSLVLDQHILKTCAEGGVSKIRNILEDAEVYLNNLVYEYIFVSADECTRINCATYYQSDKDKGSVLQIMNKV
jgi:hypothetical protein